MRRSFAYWSYLLLAVGFGFILPSLFAFWLWDAAALKAFVRHLPGLEDVTWEKIIKIIGATFTLFTWSATAYRLWYYAERNLPERLIDYIEKCRQSAIDTRGDLLLALDERYATIPKQNDVISRRDRERRRQLLSEWLPDLKADATGPNGKLKELNNRFGVVESAFGQCTLDNATLHFVRGLECAKLADLGHADSNARNRAVTELKIAAGYDSLDVDLQREHVMQIEKAANPIDIQAIEKWVSAAEHHNETWEEGLARLYLGKSYFSLSGAAKLNGTERNAHLGDARNAIEDAITLLESKLVAARNSKSDEKLAEAYECLADVRVKLGTNPMAGTRYNDALNIFRQQGDGNSISRVLEKLKKIDIPPTTQSTMPVSHATTVVRALKDLAESHLLREEKINAQNVLLGAVSRLNQLRVPHDIGAIEFDDLRALIRAAQERAKITV